MYEWSDLSRGRALALVSARDPREFPVGIMQRDPVPPPHTGPGTFTWFTDDAEAADFMVEIVPVLLLDPESWPDFEALVDETRRIVHAVPHASMPCATSAPRGGHGPTSCGGVSSRRSARAPRISGASSACSTPIITVLTPTRWHPRTWTGW